MASYRRVQTAETLHKGKNLESALFFLTTTINKNVKKSQPEKNLVFK